MLETDQLVSLSMNEESGTSNILHHVNVSEAIINQVLEHSSGLLSDNVTNGHKRTHKEKGGWFSK